MTINRIMNGMKLTNKDSQYISLGEGKHYLFLLTQPNVSAVSSQCMSVEVEAEFQYGRIVFLAVIHQEQFDSCT